MDLYLHAMQPATAVVLIHRGGRGWGVGGEENLEHRPNSDCCRSIANCCQTNAQSRCLIFILPVFFSCVPFIVHF